MLGSYSLYVGWDRLSWRFKSLYGARYNAEKAAAAAGVRVDVVDDNDGFVVFSYERGDDGRTRCVYADADAVNLLQAGAIYENTVAPAGSIVAGVA